MDRAGSIGAALAATREEMGLTQAELAERAGVPLQTLRNYEQGKRSAAAETLIDLLRAMGVSLGKWFAQIPAPGGTGMVPERRMGRPRKHPV